MINLPYSQSNFNWIVIIGEFYERVDVAKSNML